MPDLPGELGVTKQAVSQLIDVLVSRGYLSGVRIPATAAGSPSS